MRGFRDEISGESRKAADPQPALPPAQRKAGPRPTKTERETV
jgi:hypothetical protein